MVLEVKNQPRNASESIRNILKIVSKELGSSSDYVSFPIVLLMWYGYDPRPTAVIYLYMYGALICILMSMLYRSFNSHFCLRHQMSEGKNCIYLYVLEGTKTVIGCLVAEEVSEFFLEY